MPKIDCVIGDINRILVDAIVCPNYGQENNHSRVSNLIYREGGVELVKAFKLLGEFKVSEVRITPGFELVTKFVLHVLAPTYSRGDKYNPRLLSKCYLNTLKLAKLKGIRSIAFPRISTGIFFFPSEEAANIAVRTVSRFLSKNEKYFDRIVFVTSNERDLDLYRKLLKKEQCN